MKKVLIYRSQLLPYSETFIKEQVLSLENWQAVLVGETQVEKGLSLDGLDVRLLGCGKLALVKKIIRKLNYLVKSYSIKQQKSLEQENANLVHVHFATEAVQIWPLVKAMKLPMLVTLHGYDINIHKEWWESGQGGALMKIYPARLSELAKENDVHFIAVSEAIRQQAIEHGIPAEKITVQYIGINSQRFSPAGLPIAQRKRRILYVGRLVEKKGASYLLQAFARIAEQMPDAELIMVGDGPLRAQLEVNASQLQLNVQFLGALNSIQVQQQLHEARVFCLPSITADNGDAEGLGIVILEAQACGVPVVTSARGGAREGILDGVTGFAFPERDVETLADKLLKLLQDDELAMAMSLIAPKFIAENFDIRNRTKLLELHYDSFC